MKMGAMATIICGRYQAGWSPAHDHQLVDEDTEHVDDRDLAAQGVAGEGRGREQGGGRH